MVEHSKTKSTQPRSETFWVTLYLSGEQACGDPQQDLGADLHLVVHEGGDLALRHLARRALQEGISRLQVNQKEIKISHASEASLIPLM